MERAMTVEEKIRRAEEIYEKRKQGEKRPVATVNVNQKKDLKLFKKMVIQLLICVAIYLVIYMVQNNNYIFSEDFINKVNEILSYDTNFTEIYENIKNQVNSWFNPNQEQNSQEQNNQENVQETEQGIGGAEENTEDMQVAEGGDEVVNNAETTNDEQATPLTPEEQEIADIKNTTTFIKPIEGTISSPFGWRDSATGSVPKNHTGTDIAANLGTKIKSATDGEVVLCSEEGDYGKHLKIQIGEVSIIYAHCNNLYVKQGDKATQGQEIAEVGSTGNSTGPHLHFEVRLREKQIDPQKILEL